MSELVINNHIIDASLDKILKTIKSELSNGKLAKIENKGSEFRVTCPHNEHKSGMENKPSCNICATSTGDIEFGYFHCFRGNTKVITKEFGAIEINKIVNESVHILNGKGEWEETVFHSYGVQSLMKISLSCNTKKKIIYATPEHEWLIKNKKTKIQTKYLQKGQYLSKCLPNKVCDVSLDYAGVIHGFCYGDGQCTHRNIKLNKYYNRCFLYNESDSELKKYFKNINFRPRIAGNNKVYECADFMTNRDLKLIPDINESDSYLLGFLAGYFVADGNCFENRISIYSHKYEDLYKIQQICTKLGIVSTEIGVSNIHKGKRGCLFVKEDTKGYSLRLVRRSIPDKFFITEKGRHSSQKYFGKLCYKIIDVEETDLKEDVFCCQTSTHSFALEHFILTGNCFTCNDSGPLYHFVAECFDKDDEFGKEWLLGRFGHTLVEERTSSIIENIDLDFVSKKSLFQKNETKYLNETNLDNLQTWHPYMAKRKLSRDICEKFKLRYDSKSDCVVFPVYDENNKLYMMTKRSVTGKQFYIDKDTDKPVYLLYHILNNNINYAIVCESQINSLYCQSIGLSAIATFGCNITKRQFDLLNKSCIRHYILAFDGDDAGNRGIKKFINNIRKDVFVDVLKLPKGKDINDLTKEEVIELLENEGLNYEELVKLNK